MRPWVIGGRGLLGSALMPYLPPSAVQTGRDVDLTDERALEAFAQKFGPFTHILLLGAYTEVDLAEKERERAFLVNGEGTKFVAKIAAAMGASFIYLSTDYIFDGKKKSPYLETDAEGPLSVYGASKWRGEEMARKHHPRPLILRTSWLFGPNKKNFVDWVRFEKKSALHIVTTQKSRPTYTLDLAKMIIALLDEEGTYHVANDGEATRYLLAKAATDRPDLIPVEQLLLPAKRPLYSVLSLEKIKQKLAIRTWQEALKEYLHA